MAKIPLTEGFSLLSEGDHKLVITGVNYEADFGKLEIKTKDVNTNQAFTERFNLINKDGTPCEPAMNAFSYAAKVALNDFSATEVDPEDLVGYKYEVTIEHTKVDSKREPGKQMTFAKVVERRVCEEAPEVKAPQQTTINLDDLLA